MNGKARMAQHDTMTERATEVQRTGDVPSLTTLRGILALWVVVGHFWDHLVILVPWAHPFEPFAAKGQMAVPGFFVLSGWVMARNYSEWFRRITPSGAVRFWALRLARLYPVHLATIAALACATLPALVAGTPDPLRHYSLGGLALNLLLVHAWMPHPSFEWNYPSWSISAEWFAYLFFPLLTRLFWGLRKIPEAATAIGIAGLCATCWKTMWMSHMPFDLLFLVLVGFATGMAIHWAASPNRGSVPVPRLVPDAALLAMPVICLVAPARTAFLFLCILPVVAIWALSRLGSRCSRVWGFFPLLVLGEASYSLYMVHAVVEKFVIRVLPPTAWAGRGPAAAHFAAVAYVGAVALATWGTYTLVERPSRRRLRRLFLDDGKGPAKPGLPPPPCKE